MPLQISQKQFFDILQKVCPVAPVKSSLQILSNIKVHVNDGKMEITATDLDHSILVSEDVQGSDIFEIAVNARKAFDLVREIPDGEIAIEIDENVLSLVSEKGFSCKISGADVRDFPEFPSVDAGISVTVLASDLKRMVQKSSFAVSKDSSRSCLCGVNWEIENEKMTMVATDGHRLGCCSIFASFDVAEKISAIVSQKTLTHISKILDTGDQTAAVTVTFGDKYLLFATEKMTLCSKLVEGPYPDYKKVIPKNNPKTAVIEKSVLLDAVRRVSVLSSQKTHLVKFCFSNNTLEIVVLNRDIGGEAREVIAVSYEGDEHTIGLNATYLNEILGIIDSPKVRFEMNTQISACLIFPETKDENQKSEYFSLIMPLRIMDEL